MEEEKGLQETSETAESRYPLAAEGSCGPTWRGWVLSIIVAVILSVTATLLLGGSSAFHADRGVAAGAGGYGSGSGRNCCPPADAGK